MQIKLTAICTSLGWHTLPRWESLIPSTNGTRGKTRHTQGHTCDVEPLFRTDCSCMWVLWLRVSRHRPWASVCMYEVSDASKAPAGCCKRNTRAWHSWSATGCEDTPCCTSVCPADKLNEPCRQQTHTDSPSQAKRMMESSERVPNSDVRAVFLSDAMAE